jgi:acyl-homoserine lactone acylase PvdQ
MQASEQVARLAPAPARCQLGPGKDLEAFRRCFDPWPALSLNYLYADVSETIGWQPAADVPQRRSGRRGTAQRRGGGECDRPRPC